MSVTSDISANRAANPGFFTWGMFWLALATLGIGLSANAASFSIVDTVLIRPLD